MKVLTDKSAEYQAAKIQPKTFTKKHACHWCGSELEITDKDITTVPAKLIDRDETIPAKGFYCPLCNGVNITG